MEYKDELSLVLGEQKKQKRPPNGYILYCLEKRTELRGLHPDLPNVQISRMLGDNWKALDESERRPYKEKAKALQADFKQKCPDYKYEKARERRLAQEMAIQNRNQAHSNEILQSDLETLLSFMKASNYFQQNQQTQPVQNVSVPGMSTGLSEPQYNMTNDFHPFGQIDFFDQR
ncbi:HMG box family protein [Histomonas meleagridis]|uniref:HMG box family protein n=1 Tax=Histomonas meleagridis TaxID=135588 RepID=UPI00355989C9|nr:HMG box family protein [Histomonas meleagridis]KAH0800816.1 HMG box family protein [Histomonas meleagridis]